MKEVTIWSGGNEKATTNKIYTVAYFICAVLFLVVNVMMFFVGYESSESSKSILSSILCGFVFFGITWWIPLGLFLLSKDEYLMIGLNKQVHLYLYTLEEFVKLGEIPQDKFVLFSDKSGVVLAETKYEKETKNCCNGVKYFHQFVDMFEKTTGEPFYANN